MFCGTKDEDFNLWIGEHYPANNLSQQSLQNWKESTLALKFQKSAPGLEGRVGGKENGTQGKKLK